MDLQEFRGIDPRLWEPGYDPRRPNMPFESDVGLMDLRRCGNEPHLMFNPRLSEPGYDPRRPNIARQTDIGLMDLASLNLGDLAKPAVVPINPRPRPTFNPYLSHPGYDPRRPNFQSDLGLMDLKKKVKEKTKVNYKQTVNNYENIKDITNTHETTNETHNGNVIHGNKYILTGGVNTGIANFK